MRGSSAHTYQIKSLSHQDYYKYVIKLAGGAYKKLRDFWENNFRTEGYL
jgi:hypothetical protein